jgi:hypothetical protein
MASHFVAVRVRPQTGDERGREAVVDYEACVGSDGAAALRLPPPPAKQRVSAVPGRGAAKSAAAPAPLKQFGGYRHVFTAADDNRALFTAALLPQLRRVVAEGAILGVPCYGHTGSGKTHTCVGYGAEMGLITLAAEALFELLAAQGQGFSLAVRFAEIYNDRVYDLLADGRRELFARTDAEGEVVFRAAAAAVDAAGGVWTSGLTTVAVASAADADRLLRAGMARRAQGSSNLHAQSSRSHAFFEFEVVNGALLAARDAVTAAEAALTPVGSLRDTCQMAYEAGLFTHVSAEGRYEANPHPDPALKTALADSEAVLAPYTQRVAAAKQAEADVIAAGAPTLGAGTVFVDLAGSECERLVTNGAGARLKQSPAELKEARQINASLLALKECIRALHGRSAAAAAHVPYRNSTLTKALKNFLSPVSGRNATTMMIANVCPSAEQLLLTHSTLAYAEMVAATPAN